MTISPTIAGQLANGVYGVLGNDNVLDGFRERNATGSGLTDLFDLGGEAQRFHGVSGGRLVHSQTGFGTLLKGKGSLQGDVAIVCRGTKIGVDWLTNFTVSLAPGPANTTVHAGFDRVFRSFKSQIDIGMKGLNPGTIHIVGHSLGGALANLLALQYAGRASIKLYTFGAPRPGLGNFAQAIKQRVGPENVKRVYALADPVPLVPLFPFCHAPYANGRSVTAGGQNFNLYAHGMENYLAAVAGKSWEDLPVDRVPFRRSVDDWLKIAKLSNASPMNAVALLALNEALRGILRQVAGTAFGFGLIGAVTVLDTLAFALQQAISISRALGRMVRRFVTEVMRFLGRAVKDVTALTGAFIRYVLQLLYQALASSSRAALARFA